MTHSLLFLLIIFLFLIFVSVAATVWLRLPLRSVELPTSTRSG
jgi:hypothetical protein